MAQNVIKSYNTVQLHRQLFRNKVANRLMIGAAVFVVLIGFVWGGKYIGLGDYSDKVGSIFKRDKATPVVTDANSSAEVDTGQGGPLPGASSEGEANSSSGSGGSSGQSGSAPSANSSRPAATPAPAPAATSACGNTAIPAAACTALLAIEQNGPKNNPHVAMDQGQLAQIPDGSVIVIDKASWASVSDSQANVNFSITIQGQVYNASLAMQNNGGTWQAVNFALQ